MEATDDVSLVNGVNYPEWRVHRHVGVRTAADLAALTPNEIDLDLENAEFVYLWGARLTRVPSAWPDQAGAYIPFVSFDPAGEQQLVHALWAWFDELRERAADEGLTLRVYSYSPIEATRLRQIGQPDEIDDFLASDQWVGLLPLMRAKFLTNDALPIGERAPLQLQAKREARAMQFSRRSVAGARRSQPAMQPVA